MQWIQERGQALGTSGFALLLLGGYLGLVWSPPDVTQGNAMRIMYVHVPVAWCMYLAFFCTFVGSAAYLWKKDLMWDRFAAASAEVGVLLTALTLVTGSIWGRPIWGVYWTWDPRITTTAILFVIYVGYVMLRTLQPDPIARARQSAVIGIIGVLDIPLIQESVYWWRSLHQQATILRPGLGSPPIDARMELALFVNVVAFTILFVFLLGQRLRLGELEGQRDRLLWEDAQRV